MKFTVFSILYHILVWIFLLIIPYITTDQVFNNLDNINSSYLQLSLSISSVLMLTFYLNYLVLIPRILLTKKYWLYFGLLLTIVVIVILFCIAVFFTFGYDPLAVPTENSIFERIIPVIIINALSIWLLTIISSMLWVAFKRIAQVESEKLKAQIASLKFQINPHFLFNTLNNIYATAIDTSPKAADMVDKLSEMMRYTMKDIQKETVSLEDEINYITNYIELQKIRLDRSVKLEYKSIENLTDVQIAPMLLIPFIENAFKYGVNSEQKSYIKVEISLNSMEFQLKVLNSKVNVQRDISEKTGLGIENTKHRLNLIYPSKHLLVIHDSEKAYSVTLHINLI